MVKLKPNNLNNVTIYKESIIKQRRGVAARGSAMQRRSQAQRGQARQRQGTVERSGATASPGVAKF